MFRERKSNSLSILLLANLEALFTKSITFSSVIHRLKENCIVGRAEGGGVGGVEGREVLAGQARLQFLPLSASDMRC